MPGLLDLAASSKMELGAAADVTANILRTFNFDAKESGRVADILAKGAATANQDVAGLAKSMEIAGPVANSLNLSFESVAAATGLMADAGVDGSTAGRMLRQGMLRLAKPTGEAGKLLKKMGVEAFDADGNMKSLDKVVGELEKGLEGQTKQQRAAALATIFGSESTAGWTVLLDKGSGVLKDYTVDLENSEGAAKKMADVMQDNAEGSIIRMQSALSGLKIELGEKLLPFLAQGADFIGDLANKMSEWDEETVTTIAHTAMLVTAVLGVTTVVAGLVAGLGAFMMVAGPIGLAIAGGTLLLGGLAAAVYKSTLETENSNKVNLENAKSLSEQALELQKNADTFDNLSDKAKISNSELAQLHDLNQRIAQGGSSDEIAKLQHQYDKLAEKSGLSKEELEKLFGANDSLIKQSPNVEQSISEQGNAFAKNTEEVRKYIETLDKMSQNELTNERTVAIERAAEINKEITKQKKEQEQLDEKLGEYEKINNMSYEERAKRLDEMAILSKDMTLSEEKRNELGAELALLIDVQAGKYQEVTLEIRDQMIEKAKSIEKNEEELFLIGQIDTELANIKLRRLDINEEGERGLIVLEEALAKNHETLSNLDAEYEKNGKLTEEQQKQKESVTGRVEQLQEAQNYINTELELYGSVNSLVESQKHLLSEGTQEKIKSLESTLGIEVAEGNILQQIQEKNAKLVEERDQLEINRELQGANTKEIDGQITAINEKINAGDGVVLQMLKELDILELVRDGIILNGTELQAYLEGLGYSTEEAFSLAQQLSGETVKALEEGTEESKQAGKDKGDAHKDGLDSTKGDNEKAGKDVSDGSEKGLDTNEDKAKKSGKDKGDGHKSGLDSTKGANEKSAKDVSDGANKNLNTNETGAQKAGTNKGTAHKSGLDSTKSANLSVGSLISLGVTNTLSQTTDGGGGLRAGSLFHQALSGQAGNASTAGKTVATSGKTGLESVKTTSAGTDFVSGFANSISSGRGSIWTTAWSLGKHALSALKGAIDSKSPAKETIKEGINFVDGFALAIKDETGTAVKGATKLGTSSVVALADGIVDKRKDALKEVTRLFKDIRSEVSDATDAEIADLKKNNDEIKKIEKRAGEDVHLIKIKASQAKRKLTEAESIRIRRIEEDAAKKMQALQAKNNKVELDIAKRQNAEMLKLAEEYVQGKKEKGEMNLADEIYFWNAMYRTAEKGSDLYEMALNKHQETVKTLRTEMEATYEKHANRITEIDKKLLDDTKKLNDEYNQVYSSRVDQLTNVAGLLDEFVEKEYVYGYTLIQNLQSQVDALEEFGTVIGSLGSRINNDALFEELQALGPKSITELRALNDMSDEELKQFSGLYETRFELARTQATKELEPLKDDITQQIKELNKASQKELSIVEKEWKQSIKDIVQGTKKEFDSMHQVGIDAMRGLDLGMLSKESELMATARRIANSIRAEIQSALDINSPSGVMERDVGHWVPAGIARGIEGNLGVVKKAMAKMSESFKVKTADYKVDFGKLAFAVGENKQTLKVEHEIKQTGVEKLLLQLIDTVQNNNQKTVPSGAPITINSRDDAESIARAVERVNRRTAFRMG